MDFEELQRLLHLFITRCGPQHSTVASRSVTNACKLSHLAVQNFYRGATANPLILLTLDIFLQRHAREHPLPKTPEHT
ncbi:uncharacterized protein PHALS_06556 [Plasmopara halstedii]|uniref:Uncharacterized protein n=1 Tax=Plasmopara halstedii TaxID=4781 RepID=A0A0P1B5G0_PLAHL|nr:uncharacterized protein PHALS_06556 [Plasmopara halstedii]CEG48751.1 hypothetical protein PHALS_06556 [Plasmopara halstedii]|eukprot:XP_024585120.1 hypothetical protein PHALS_06556 [Plasmopara halstedii]